MSHEEQIKVAKRIITVMLCILFGCYTAFLLGAQWFAIILPPKFASIDLYILEHNWCMFLISTLVWIPQLILFYHIVLQQWKINWKVLVPITLVLIALSAVRVFLGVYAFPEYAIMISTLTDLIASIGIPLVVGKFVYKKDFEKLLIIILVGFLCVYGYTELSLRIKSITSFGISKSMTVGLICLIDTFIVLITSYIYSNILKKEGNKMGFPITWGAGTKETVDKAKADKAAKKEAKKGKK